jgi:hypothetical protein
MLPVNAPLTSQRRQYQSMPIRNKVTDFASFGPASVKRTHRLPGCSHAESIESQLLAVARPASASTPPTAVAAPPTAAAAAPAAGTAPKKPGPPPPPPRAEAEATAEGVQHNNNKLLYTAEHLASLGRIQLRRLVKQHGLDESGDDAAIRARLAAVVDPANATSSSAAIAAPAAAPPAVAAGSVAAAAAIAALTAVAAAPSVAPPAVVSAGSRLYTAEHLAGLGQIQLRKLAQQHGLDTAGGPAALRERLGALPHPQAAAAAAAALVAAAGTTGTAAQVDGSEGEERAAGEGEGEAEEDGDAVEEGEGGEEEERHPSFALRMTEPLPATALLRCPVREGGFQTVFAGGDPVDEGEVRRVARRGVFVGCANSLPPTEQ